MNLTTHHLPSAAFLRQRAATEARLGCRLVKYFFDDTPAIGYGEYDALLEENAKIRAAVAEARKALARAFGDESA